MKFKASNPVTKNFILLKVRESWRFVEELVDQAVFFIKIDLIWVTVSEYFKG